MTVGGGQRQGGPVSSTLTGTATLERRLLEQTGGPMEIPPVDKAGRQRGVRARAHGPVPDTTTQMGITEAASVAERSRQAYCRLLKVFLEFEGIKSLRVPAEVLDAKLVHYFDTLYLEGRDPSTGLKVLSALQFHVADYSTKGRLQLP